MRRLASYFGLVPSTYQSGDTQARHGRITKKGRSDARWLAVEAAEHLRKAPSPLRALCNRVSRKRGDNVAVVAVARKLAELDWHLLTRQEDYLYEKPHRTQDKRSSVRKLARHRFSLLASVPLQSCGVQHGCDVEAISVCPTSGVQPLKLILITKLFT